MRKSLAPSVSKKFRSPLCSLNKVSLLNGSDNQNPDTPLPYPNSKYFAVVWAKSSARKHKKWEEDALMEVIPPQRMAILRSASSGKEISKGTSLKIQELIQLESGSRISFGGKDIELINDLTWEEYSKLIKHGSQNLDPVSSKPNSFSSSSSYRTVPYMNFKPVGKKSSGIGSNSLTIPKKPHPSLLSSDPNALILPRPGPEIILSRSSSSTESVVDVVVDPKLAKNLRPHQKSGIIFLYQCVMGFKTIHNYGAILADEMGLGKTLTTITLIWTLLKQSPWKMSPEVSRALILVPSSLVKNWKAEFNKWLGMERIRVFAVDSNSNRFEEYVKRPNDSVVVISYEMFVKSFESLKTINFGILVADEGHRLKNANIKASTYIQSMNVLKRIILTGTPIQNDLKEFYSLVSLVNPGILGTPQEFCHEYEAPIVRGKEPNSTREEIEISKSKTEDLSIKTKQFILRRTQDVIKAHLPPKTENVLFARPSELQYEMYLKALEDIDWKFDGSGLSGESVLNTILNLRKICNHPSLVFDTTHSSLTLEEQSSKLGIVSTILSELSATSEKIVIVSISTQVLDLLEELCNHYGYCKLRLDGSTSSNNRQNIVNRFNDKNSKDFVLLLSSKAGGSGLNLIGGSRIILYDMDWNPAHDSQAMARIWRDGQTKPVHVYRLVTAGTIEEKIFQRQVTKQALGQGLVDESSIKSHFSKEELKDLFSLKPFGETDCETHDILGCHCLSSNSETEVITEAQTFRRCQLGKPSTSVENKSGMKDLLNWKHYNDFSDLSDPLINLCSSFLTFLFQNKV